MKRIENLNKLYQYTIDFPQNIKHWDGIKIIRELIYIIQEFEDDIEENFLNQQLNEINDILGLGEDPQDIDDLLAFEIIKGAE